MLQVLVADASREGCTGEIASTIGNERVQHGLTAGVTSCGDGRSAARFDAVSVGSPVSLGHRCSAAVDNLEAEPACLNSHPAWLFQLGPQR